MTRKWSNQNLPGALHYVTGNVVKRIPIFKQERCCLAFLEECADLLRKWPCKLIAYVITGLVASGKDYRWSSFRAFHLDSDEPLPVDHDWWWPDDSEKLSKAMKELGWRTYHNRNSKK